MRKAIVCILLALIMICAIAIPSAHSESKQMFGRFIEIRHEMYMGLNGVWIYEYVVYDKDTGLVYLYITDGKSMLSVTPYMMRDYYGEITVGLYNRETGGIDPAESSRLVDEDEMWEIKK